MMQRKQKKGWRGDKARPANRAKTWSAKDRDPKRDRRNWRKDTPSPEILWIG